MGWGLRRGLGHKIMESSEVQGPRLAGKEEKSLNMSREEKIKDIDKSLMATLKICATEKIDPAEFKKLTQPLRNIHKKWKREEWKKSALIFSFVFGLIAVLYQVEATAEFISAVAKIGMVKFVLPYWDWTTIHAADCLFVNPYRTPDGITEEDCEPLVNLSEVERAQDMSQDEMTDDHLFTGVPVIITDAMSDWKAVTDGSFDIKYITKLYKEDPILSGTAVCSVSGMDTTSTLQAVLSEVDTLNLYQIHWGHCRLPAAKVLRQYYRRPYFLPPMVEADPVNFIIVGGGKTEQTPTEYRAFDPANMQVTWVSLVKGQMKFKLIPDPICARTKCKVLEGTLKAGETLVYCNDFWFLEYSASSIGETVAISSGGAWSD